MSQTSMKLNSIIRVDFKAPKRVKSVKAISKKAEAIGLKLAWTGTKLDDKWVAWHREVAS